MIRLAAVLVSLAVLPPAALAVDLSPPDLPPIAEKTLVNGGVYVQAWEDETRKDGAIDVYAAVDIDAPAAVIWNVMTNCARTENIVPKMKSCEIIEKSPDGLWDIRKQKTKINFLISHTSIFRSDYAANKSITISREGGDMKVQEGVWKLMPLNPGATRLTYRAASAPSFPVSSKKMIKSTEENMPVILGNLRDAAEADFALLK